MSHAGWLTNMVYAMRLHVINSCIATLRLSSGYPNTNLTILIRSAASKCMHKS